MSVPQFGDDFYYLHVLEDGTEERTPHPPQGKPCMRVLVMADYEQVTNNSILQVYSDARSFALVPLPPRGAGWVRQRRKKYQPNDVEVWRRPRQ